VTETVGVGGSYFQFFQNSVKALVPVLTPKTPLRETLPVFTDELLGVKMEDVTRNTEQINQIRAILAKVNLPEDQQKRAMEQLATAEANLATAITGAMKHIVDAKIEVGGDTEGAKGMVVLTRSVGQISTPAAKTQLQQSLTPLANAPTTTGNHRNAVVNLNRLIVR
jgi:hypothetical protein